MGKGSRARRAAKKVKELDMWEGYDIGSAATVTTSTGNTWKGGPFCGKDHKVPTLVFDGPVKVYAGSGMQHCPPPPGAVVLDLAANYPPAVTVQGFTIPGVIRPRIGFNWPDGSVPDLDAAQWSAIARTLARMGKPIFVACNAGHGRTGTALTILGHFLKAYPAKDTDPIEWVRTVYCDEAVEQVAQVLYVKLITGRDTACEGSLVGKAGSAVWTSLCPKKVDKDWCNRDKGHTGACDTRQRHILLREGLASDGAAPPVLVSDGKVTPASALAGVLTPGGAHKVLREGPCAAWCIRNKPHVGGCYGPPPTKQAAWAYCPKLIKCMEPSGHPGSCVDAHGKEIG